MRAKSLESGDIAVQDLTPSLGVTPFLSGWVALLLGVLGVVTGVAASENALNLDGGAPPNVTQGKHTYDFLQPGQKHSEDSPLHPGEGWMALRKGKNVWEIVSTKIMTRKIDSDTAGNGDVVISSPYQDAVAFFRTPLVKQGPILTPSDLDKKLPFYVTLIDSSPSLHLDFNGEAYEFVVTKQKAPAYTGNEFSYPLTVRVGKKSSIIKESLDSNIDAITIVWAGDLDHDGKLDIIIEPAYLNASGLCVLFSSKARPTELFGHKSCHIGSGC